MCHKAVSQTGVRKKIRHTHSYFQKEMKGFTKDKLKEMSVVPDGKGGYRAMTKEEKEKIISDRNKTLPKLNRIEFTKSFPLTPEECFSVRKISLTLFGIPMPKQSVRSAKGHFWQPAKMVERTKDYIRQISEQLPADFKMFEHEVHITKMHFVYPPLKAFHKIKGRMDEIRAGEIFYKNTRPDLPDNMKKLCLDSMTGLVYKDDGLIVSEDNVKKYYGTGGCIIIEMEGY
jgi:Holliday junction resolvase RusA-like endonuclease